MPQQADAGQIGRSQRERVLSTTSHITVKQPSHASGQLTGHEGQLRFNAVDINTSVFFNAIGSNAQRLTVNPGARLQSCHVEFATSADWSVGTTWIQMGIDRSSNLDIPASIFLGPGGIMDPYGGNPSWEGDYPINPGTDWIFLDCIEGVSGGRNLKFAWTWVEP